MTNTKSFGITKRMVYGAYKAVKANRGGAGIDNILVENCGTEWLWNRMASGCYFPPSVKAVQIP